jgi:hypothetical protein
MAFSCAIALSHHAYVLVTYVIHIYESIYKFIDDNFSTFSVVRSGVSADVLEITERAV